MASDPGAKQNITRFDKLVNPDGTPTEYFMRILQMRGNLVSDINTLIEEILSRNVIAGVGLDGGGNLGAGDVTLDANASAILDLLGNTHGSIIYRDSGAWALLAPGAAGQVLQTNGAGADPSWVAASAGGGRTPFKLGVMPALSGFTQVNIAGNFSITETAGKAFAFFDASPATGSKVAMVSRAVPVSTPYRVAICFALNSPAMQYLVPAWGFRKTGGPNLHVMAAIPSRYYSATAFEIMTWSSPTVRVSTGGFGQTVAAPNFANGFVWVGLRDDGTNVHWEMSSDGVNWFHQYSISKASGYLGSTGYNEICAGMYSESDGSHTGTTFAWNLSLLDWDDNGLARSYG